MAKKLAEWPRLVEIAGRTNEPHRVAFYLYDLASELHALWNRGNDLTRPCAFCRRRCRPRHRRKSRWRVPQPLLFPPVLVFWG